MSLRNVVEGEKPRSLCDTRVQHGEKPLDHHLRYVAIEGPLGVGKTTLAKRLSTSLRAELILERPVDNPFLDDFYRQPERFALPTQLHFLVSRCRALRDLADNAEGASCWVSDFLFQKDRLFASLTLNDRDLELYHSVARELEFDLLVPDLVLYLQAPLDVLYDRIEKRAVPSEQAIASSYIARLQTAYTEMFHNYNDTPLLIINATDIDFAQNEQDYERLLQQIKTVQAGKHYFNPSPEVA